MITCPKPYSLHQRLGHLPNSPASQQSIFPTHLCLVHETLYVWVDDLERIGVVKTVVRKRWTGKRHETNTYRYVSAVPLRNADDAMPVNGCEITTHAADSKVLYQQPPRFITHRVLCFATIKLYNRHT